MEPTQPNQNREDKTMIGAIGQTQESNSKSVFEALPPRILALAKIETRYRNIRFLMKALFAIPAVILGSNFAEHGFFFSFSVGQPLPLDHVWLFSLWAGATWLVLMTLGSTLPESFFRAFSRTPWDASTFPHGVQKAARQVSLSCPPEFANSEPRVAAAMSKSQERLTARMIVLAGQVEGLDLVRDWASRKSWMESLRVSLKQLLSETKAYERSVAECIQFNALTSDAGRDMNREALIERIP